MSHDATYHRTFLPDGPFESVCRHNCHTNGGKSNKLSDFEPQFIKPKPTTTPGGFQTADMTHRPAPYYRSQKRRFAYMHINGQLRPIHIVDKIDQNFALYSTLWEMEYSQLVRDGADRFVPVVDQNYMVVGHVGTVTGLRLAVVPDANNQVQDHHDIEKYLQGDEPMFVAHKPPSGWVEYDTKAPRLHYSVVTSIDGEVISGTISGSDPGAIAVAGPVEYITGAAVVLRLGAAVAKGLIKALVRKAISSNVAKELAGPTRKLLERVLARRAAAKAARMARNTYNPITGITPTHHRAFIDAAQETRLIIVVRHTNPKSIPLIEKGCPGKPKDLEFINTSPQSGIVMANTPLEVGKAQRLGYLVIGENKKAQRIVLKGKTEVAEDVPLPSTFWQLEKGQVIDPKLKKPIVGDYDLMGVINPAAPGRNLGLIARNGESLTDVTNPIVQRAARALNSRMDMPRVLHGPQDMYKGFRKTASAYLPDGTVKHFETEAAVKAFYDALGRQTRTGAYPRPGVGTPVTDELAQRRRAR